MRVTIFPNNTALEDGQPIAWTKADFKRAGIELDRTMEHAGEAGLAWYRCGTCGGETIPVFHKVRAGRCTCGADLDNELLYVIFPTKEVVQTAHGLKTGGAKARRRHQKIDGVLWLECGICSKIRPETDYNKCSSSWCGRQNVCNTCRPGYQARSRKKKVSR